MSNKYNISKNVVRKYVENEYERYSELSPNNSMIYVTVIMPKLRRQRRVFSDSTFSEDIEMIMESLAKNEISDEIVQDILEFSIANL